MLEDKENVNKDRETTSKNKETTSKVPQITRKEEEDNEEIKPARTSESESDVILSTADNAVRTIDIVVSDTSVAGDKSQVEHDSVQNLPDKYDDEGKVGEREISETDNESETVESSSGGVRKAERMFRTLSFETDINVAPVNWLRGENGQMGKYRLDKLIVMLTNI